MTLELQQHLQREMEDALALPLDRRQDAIRTVLIHQNDALVDCQRKTAERVKTIVADIPQMKQDINEIKGIVEKGKKTFLKIAWEMMKYIVVGGGLTEFVRYLMTHT